MQYSELNTGNKERTISTSSKNKKFRETGREKEKKSLSGKDEG